MREDAAANGYGDACMPCYDANGRHVLMPPDGASEPRPLSQSETIAAIVIRVFNGADLNRCCLEALAADSGGCFEVMVVDNGSTDEAPTPVHRK
jgi:hypothetical protein